MERPGLFIFNVCNDLIRTIPTAPRADNNNEDIDTNSEGPFVGCSWDIGYYSLGQELVGSRQK